MKGNSPLRLAAALANPRRKEEVVSDTLIIVFVRPAGEVFFQNSDRTPKTPGGTPVF